MVKKISQREAHRLKRRVQFLEETFRRGYGSRIYTVPVSDKCLAVVETSSILGHPVLAKVDGPNIAFYGVTL